MSAKTDNKQRQLITNDIFKRIGRLALAFLVVIVLSSVTWEILSTCASNSNSIQKQDSEGTTSATEITVTITGISLQDIPTNQVIQSTGFSDEWKLSFSAAGTVLFGLMANGFFFGPLTTKISLCIDYIVGVVFLCVAVLCAAVAYMI